MSFWSNKDTPSKRLWQCFVCNLKVDNYAEYAEHIINKHEFGREYIICPIDSCKAPIRCLKSHFKAIHPKRPIPQNMQMKAIIWKDYKSNKTKKPTFKEGWFESLKNGGAKLYYRSGYEFEVYKCLENDNDVKSFKAEPFKVPYYFENSWHNYIPDIKVEYKDGTIDIWEIKPKTQMSQEKNQAKWNAMNKYANNLGWGFSVINESGIDKLKHKVKKQNF